MAVSAADAARMEAVALEAGQRLDGAEPDDVLAWAAGAFGTGLCVAASMADALLIDLASRAIPGIDVVFLDTGYHFAETLETRDRVQKRYPVRVRTMLPQQSVAQQDATFGPALHGRDPDACCSLRKVEPLRRALQPYSAWASGLRRDESESRRDVGVVEWDHKRTMVKLNPLANWTQAQVDEYVIAHDVEVNPLIYDGYPSIGCAPCTRKVMLGEDARAGRWSGSRKTECGLHLD